MATVATLTAKFDGETTGLKRAVTEGTTLVTGFKSQLQGLFEVAAGVELSKIFDSMLPSAKAGVNALDQFGNAAFKLQSITGATGEQVTGLMAVFERYGVGIDEAVVKLQVFQRHLHGIEDESEDVIVKGRGFAATMADIGAKFQDVNGNSLGTVEALFNIADAFKNTVPAADAGGVAAEIFGRNAAALVPILKLGRAGIEEAMEDARKYGLVLTSEGIAAVHEFALEHKNLEEAMSGVKLQMGLALLPLMSEVARTATAMGEAFNTNVRPRLDNLKMQIEYLAPSLRLVGRALLETAEIFFGVFSTILQTVTTIGGNIFDMIDHALNPYSTHSPALVDNVKNGVEEILTSYSSVRGIAGPLNAAAVAAEKFGEATASAMKKVHDQEIDKQALAMRKAFGTEMGAEIEAAFRGAESALDSFDKVLDGLSSRIKAQQQVVDGWKESIKAVKLEITGQERALRELEQTELRPMEDAVKEQALVLRAAQYALRDYKDEIRPLADDVKEAKAAAVPFNDEVERTKTVLEHAKQALEGAKEALEPMKTAAENARIGLEPFKEDVDSAKSSLDSLKSSLEAAKKNLHDLTETPIAEAKVYEDKLKALDIQISTVQLNMARAKAAAAPGQAPAKAQMEQWQHQLEQLQAQADAVKLEEHIKIDPMKEKLKELEKPAAVPFEILKGKVGEAETAEKSLTAQVTAQEAVLRGAEGTYKDQEHAVAGLENKYKTALMGLSGLTQKVQDSQKIYDKAVDDAQPYNDDIKAKERLYQEAQTALEEYQDAVDAESRQLDELKSNVQDYKDNVLQPLKDQLQTLRDKESDMQEVYDMEAEKLSKLKGAYQDISKQRADMKAQIEDIVKATTGASHVFAGPGEGEGGEGGVEKPVGPEPPEEMKAKLDSIAGKFKTFAENIEGVNKGLTDMKTHMDEAQAWLPLVAGIGAGFATWKVLIEIMPVLTALGALATGGAFVELAAGISLAAEAIMGGAGLSVALDALGMGAVAAAGAAGIALSPVLLVIGAIAVAVGLLVAAWINDWGGIQEKTAAVWNALQPVFKFLGNALDGIAAFIVDPLIPAFMKFWGYLNEHIFPVLGTLKDVYLALLGKELGIVAGFIGGVIKTFTDLGTAIFGGNKDLDEMVVGHLGPFELKLGAIKSAFQVLVDFIKNVVGNVISNWVKTEITDPLDAVHQHLQDFLDFVNGTPGKSASDTANAKAVASGVGVISGPAGPNVPTPHATGTTFSTGGLSLVGERGPELVNLPRGASVIPAGLAGSAAGGDGNRGPLVHIDARGANFLTRQGMTEFAQIIEQAMAQRERKKQYTSGSGAGMS